MSLGCAAAAAHADSVSDYIHFEAGIGGSAYQRSPQGVWWQNGFRHELSLTAPAFRAGLAGNIWQHGAFGIDWHADYVWLGTVHTDAAIPTPKTNTTSGHWSGPDFVGYNAANPCSGPCTNMSEFHGSGHDMGAMFTLEPHYDLYGWRLGVEAGPYVHRVTWSIDVANWYDSALGTFHSLHVEHNPTWQVSWTVGASISRGPLSLRYNYFRNGSPLTQSNPVPPGWSGAHVLMAAYRF
ncbi:hypothetical protein [Paraburkholderia fungorum]|uniref:hypothetical protein n=1 Tax=Paraburkholderia fungorum TaxID=134537 RepID=UPI0038779394